MTPDIVQLAKRFVDHKLQCSVPDEQMSVRTGDAFVLLLRDMQLCANRVKPLGRDECFKYNLLVCNDLMQPTGKQNR